MKAVSELVSNPPGENHKSFSIYPNPARDRVSIYAPGSQAQLIEIYNLTGHKLGVAMLDQHGEASISLSGYPPGLLLIKVGNHVEKVVLLKD